MMRCCHNFNKVLFNVNSLLLAGKNYASSLMYRNETVTETCGYILFIRHISPFIQRLHNINTNHE